MNCPMASEGESTTDFSDTDVSPAGGTDDSTSGLSSNSEGSSDDSVLSGSTWSTESGSSDSECDSWALRHGSPLSCLKFLLSNSRTTSSIKIKLEYQIEFMDQKLPRPLSMSCDVTAATSAQKRKLRFPQY